MKIPVLKTKRFVLRSYRMSDAEAATKNLQHKEINKYLSSVPYPYYLKDAETWIASQIKEHKKKEPGSIVWVIEKEGEMLGAIGLSSIAYGHKAEIGYWLAKPAWGQGVMTEVCQKIVSFAFSELSLVRVLAFVFEGNVGSEKVLERNGFKWEGFCKKEVKKKGRYYSCNLYARIK